MRKRRNSINLGLFPSLEARGQQKQLSNHSQQISDKSKMLSTTSTEFQQNPKQNSNLMTPPKKNTKGGKPKGINQKNIIENVKQDKGKVAQGEGTGYYSDLTIDCFMKRSDGEGIDGEKDNIIIKQESDSSNKTQIVQQNAENSNRNTSSSSSVPCKRQFSEDRISQTQKNLADSKIINTASERESESAKKVQTFLKYTLLNQSLMQDTPSNISRRNGFEIRDNKYSAIKNCEDFQTACAKFDEIIHENSEINYSKFEQKDDTCYQDGQQADQLPLKQQKKTISNSIIVVAPSKKPIQEGKIIPSQKQIAQKHHDSQKNHKESLSESSQYLSQSTQMVSTPTESLQKQSHSQSSSIQDNLVSQSAAQNVNSFYPRQIGARRLTFFQGCHSMQLQEQKQLLSSSSFVPKLRLGCYSSFSYKRSSSLSLPYEKKNSSNITPLLSDSDFQAYKENRQNSKSNCSQRKNSLNDNNSLGEENEQQIKVIQNISKLSNQYYINRRRSTVEGGQIDQLRNEESIEFKSKKSEKNDILNQTKVSNEKEQVHSSSCNVKNNNKIIVSRRQFEFSIESGASKGISHSATFNNTDLLTQYSLRQNQISLNTQGEPTIHCTKENNNTQKYSSTIKTFIREGQLGKKQSEMLTQSQQAVLNEQLQCKSKDILSDSTNITRQKDRDCSQAYSEINKITENEFIHSNSKEISRCQGNMEKSIQKNEGDKTIKRKQMLISNENEESLPQSKQSCKNNNSLKNSNNIIQEKQSKRKSLDQPFQVSLGSWVSKTGNTSFYS